jgi:hypothetical protein
MGSGGYHLAMHRSPIESLEPRQLLSDNRVLFIRGADRSGGFLEATRDSQRTEQLADINNTSTSAGNHGWAQLATTLRGIGFSVEQITETVEVGAPATRQNPGAVV